MTSQPLNPQDDDAEITDLLDVKPRDAKPRNAFFSNLNFKSTKVPKVPKPTMSKPTLDKTAASKVPLSRPGGKRLPKEPGQVRPERKAGLALATTAQQRKMLPMLGVFLLLGAVSLYVNFGNASTEKPVTAFVGPGPGQPGYIPAPGTLSTTAGTSTPAGNTPPGSAAAGFMPQTTPGTPGAATSMPVVTQSAPGSTDATPVVSSAPPPVPGTTTGATGATGTGGTTSTTKTVAGTATPGSATSKPGANTPASKPGTATTATKTATATAKVAGAPGKAVPSPTDVPTEPVIPDVFSPADGKTGSTASTGSTGRSATGNANSGNASGVTISAQPASLQNVPLAAVPRQVQIAQAAPLSIQSLPAPTPPPVQPQARSVPTLSAVPVALPRVVMAQVIPPVAQSLPLPAPVTVRTPSGVTLTRGGAESTSTTPATPAAAPVAPSVVLVGTAQGDTPTAILATPAGQMIAGIGDHVTVNEVDYTVSKINTSSVLLTHLKDTLTLTETN
jgi:hypothetical protein